LIRFEVELDAVTGLQPFFEPVVAPFALFLCPQFQGRVGTAFDEVELPPAAIAEWLTSNGAASSAGTSASMDT
jgi:hypothetical protein